MYTDPKTRAWDLRFLELATLVASWSKDPSTQTGAVIVRPDRTVASIGFNGFPKQMDDSPELYANRETKYQRIIHCEMNALLHVQESCTGYTLYTVPFASCDRCAVHMIQAGIKRFVYPTIPADKEERWKKVLERSEYYMDEAGCDRTAIGPEKFGEAAAQPIFPASTACGAPHPTIPGVYCSQPVLHMGQFHATQTLAWGRK